jgi:hypothetical protein
MSRRLRLEASIEVGVPSPVTLSRQSVRVLSVVATATALSAASLTVASAAPAATTTSAGTITLKLSNVKPHAFHTITASGTVPSWTTTVTLQARVLGTSTWRTLDKVTASHSKYKDTVEFGFDDVQVRATADAVSKHKALVTKTVTVQPQVSVLYSGTLTGPGKTPPVRPGDEVYVNYSFSCPLGTTANSFGLITLEGGEPASALDDDAAGTSGSGQGFVESDSTLFSIEAIGATGAAACTTNVTIEG